MLGVGVFDGHSGQEASKYVAENMWNQVLDRISTNCFFFFINIYFCPFIFLGSSRLYRF